MDDAGLELRADDLTRESDVTDLAEDPAPETPLVVDDFAPETPLVVDDFSPVLLSTTESNPDPTPIYKL